jgi:hypothetical protein
MGFACTVGAVIVAAAGILAWRLLPAGPGHHGPPPGQDGATANGDQAAADSATPLHPAVEG